MPLAGAEHQLLARFQGMAQGADRLGVMHRHGFAAQLGGVVAAQRRHNGMNVAESGQAPGREHQGLGGVAHQAGEIVAVGQQRGHLSGSGPAHAAHEIDVGQGIAQTCDPIHVVGPGRPALAAVGIDYKGGVRAGAEVTVVSLQQHGRASVAVVNGDAVRGRRQGPVHQMRGDAHVAGVAGIGPGGRQKRQGLVHAHIHPSGGQDFQRGVVDPAALSGGQQG